MQDLRGAVALVTGASGGIGVQIARALAQAGADVAVSGRREDALKAVVDEVRQFGVRAEAVPADLSDLSQARNLVERSEQSLGPLSLLVNNAGIEITSAFTELSPEELISMVNINLTSPLLLTRSVLPGMLARRRGHVVFISSIAGKVGPAYLEPYAATKAALVGLTQSLRAEYLHSPVGFSVVCPGFSEGAGMYQRMRDEGAKSNRIIGTTTTKKVAAKVVEAIRGDLPEVIESGAPIRPVLAFGQLAPRAAEQLYSRIGMTEIFLQVATARGRAG